MRWDTGTSLSPTPNERRMSDGDDLEAANSLLLRQNDGAGLWPRSLLKASRLPFSCAGVELTSNPPCRVTGTAPPRRCVWPGSASSHLGRQWCKKPSVCGGARGQTVPGGGPTFRASSRRRHRACKSPVNVPRARQKPFAVIPPVRICAGLCQERVLRSAMLYQRWRRALRSRRTGAGFKQP